MSDITHSSIPTLTTNVTIQTVVQSILNNASKTAVYILVSAYSDHKCSPNTTQHGTLSLSPDVELGTLTEREL